MYFVSGEDDVREREGQVMIGKSNVRVGRVIGETGLV